MTRVEDPCEDTLTRLSFTTLRMPRTELNRQGYVLRYIVEPSPEPLKEPTISPDSPILRVADIFIHKLLDDSGETLETTWWVFHRRQKTQSGEWVKAVFGMTHPTDHRLKLRMENPPRWASWSSKAFANAIA